MPIAGTGISNPNSRLRLLIVAFVGTVAFGVILYARAELLVASEYPEIILDKPHRKTAQPKVKTNKTPAPTTIINEL
jgi:hypothetical protein